MRGAPLIDFRTACKVCNDPKPLCEPCAAGCEDGRLACVRCAVFRDAIDLNEDGECHEHYNEDREAARDDRVDGDIEDEWHRGRGKGF